MLYKWIRKSVSVVLIFQVQWLDWMYSMYVEDSARA